jgi:hypothetical protein
MASDGTTAKIPVASPVQASHATQPINFHPSSGKSSPQTGNAATPGIAAGAAAVEPAAKATPSRSNPAALQSGDPQALVDQLNKYVNDSGYPTQFRVAPDSGGKLIQQINPANGAVLGEFSASVFPALARAVGAPGLLIDDRV